ncbi:hypothetical protein Tco_0617625, partial [Tanacetum coccineum]
MQTQEDHSNLIQVLYIDSLKVDLAVIQNTCSEKEDSNSETASSKSLKISSLDSENKGFLSKEDLKGTRIEHGFKRAFMSLFGQDVDTFTSTMLLNVDQLQKQLDKDEFQEDGSMAAFWVIKIDMGKAVDADLVVTETSGTESEVQDDSSRSGNDTDADDADIRPIYDEEPMAEVQLTAECNIFAIGQQHTEQLEISHEGRVDQSDLRWKSMGRIFKSVGLRWIPTGKLFDSCTSKDDSEPTHGLNVNIPNIHESKQTLDLSACTSINVQKEQGFDLSAELESLFDPLFNEYFNGENQVVSKSSAVTTADASVKRQQQPDSTSSTSTLEQLSLLMETSI